MFATPWILAHEEDSRACRDREADADDRFLPIRHPALDPAQEEGCRECSSDRGDLGGPSVLVRAHGMSGHDAQARHLGDRQVDEDDAALQHHRSQRDMRRQHQHAGRECGQENAGLHLVRNHLAAFSLASVSSKSEIRSCA